MISVENLSKGYGGQELLTEISFKINRRERIGLVGRNGHGKTTLMRIITGEESQDAGNITIPKNYRTGYVKQHLTFSEGTVLRECMAGLPENEKDHHWKAEKILAGLGFSQTDMEKEPMAFSGGYQVRLNLGKVLVSQPDLLLLDEPTNYLDIASIRWIENFLQNWPGELLLITHDRGFMDAVITHTLGIHRKKVRKIEGTTDKYYSQIALEEEIHEKTRINEEKKTKEVEQFITRFRAKARLANMVQSRIKALEKKEKLNKLDKIEDLEFSFRSAGFSGKQVLVADKINFSYDNRHFIFQNFSIQVGAKDRICIIGKNGKGKTTLLKTLAGIHQPNSGEIIVNPGVAKGVFEQTNIATLNTASTIEEELMYSHEDVTRQLARNICGSMMFEGDNALKTIGVLSGGEKSRVMLGKLLVTPANLLILDEPTNHLDMEACESLLNAVDAFDGAVVMVTHNETFLHAVAERLIVFNNDTVSVFEGTYQEFLDKVGWDSEQDDKTVSDSCQTDTSYSASGKPGKKEARKLRSDIISRRSKALKPIDLKIKKIEKEIEHVETDIVDLNEKMVAVSSSGDGESIQETSMILHEKNDTVDTLYDTLTTLTDEYDAIKGRYEDELNEIP